MRAYLVLGPESSGTRLLTRILIEAGCLGDDGHEQRWDAKAPCGESPVVWRRSVPHGGDYPNVLGLVAVLEGRGYQVEAVVVTRDWQAMAASQAANGHAADVEEATARIRAAHTYIIRELDLVGRQYTMVSYEALVQRPEATIEWLMARLGLDERPIVPIYDGNAKYLDREV
jgi:LPS sulfotransferase NodH